jgi:putative transposase
VVPFRIAAWRSSRSSRAGSIGAPAPLATRWTRSVVPHRRQGLALTGPDGLLKALTKTVLETALKEELTEHPGYDKHDPAGQGSGDVRNGSRPKTVLTDSHGPVEIDVPRDRAGTFTPQIVRKRQRRLTGMDEMVLSLCAKGLTTGEISAHFAEIYGASVSKETISRITDKVVEELVDWSHRPLDGVYGAVFSTPSWSR